LSLQNFKEFHILPIGTKIDKEVGPEKEVENNMSCNSSHIYLDNQVHVGVGEVLHEESSSINFQNTKLSRHEIDSKKPKSSIGSPTNAFNEMTFSMGSPKYPNVVRDSSFRKNLFDCSASKRLSNSNRNNPQAFST
jgi:hypothetical protein